MKTLLIVYAIFLAACSSGPVFNDTMAGAPGDVENEADHEFDPCTLNGVTYPGMHHCHNPRFADRLKVCCPDGTQCSQDSFVPPHGGEGFCRF